MKDIIRTNKWANFKKRMFAQGRNEREIVEWFEVLENQIVTLEKMIYKLEHPEDMEDDGK